jgi:hypothetical protein
MEYPPRHARALCLNALIEAKAPCCTAIRLTCSEQLT